MLDAELQAARDLVLREGWLLDQREWDDWLELYLESAEYWLPCWLDEYTLTSDPKSQLSLIYYSTRAGLEDRIYRIRTEKSLASTPLPRTAHLITVNRAQREEDGDIRVESTWSTFSYKQDYSHNFFGNQVHIMHGTPSGLRIARRKVVVMNDTIPNVLDIYSI